MAISFSPPSRIAASFSTRSNSARFARVTNTPSLRSIAPHRHPSRLTISTRLYSSKPSSGANGPVFPENHFSESGGGELQHGFPPPPWSRNGAPVFVTLPADSVSLTGRMTRRKTLAASFMALRAAGVEGVVVEVWWGIVERDAPGVYDWGGYLDVVALASMYRLKVRAIMAFHQHGVGPGDSCWIPLPRWVLEEMDKEPDLAYSDRFGRRNREYISLGCDILPVLRGRSPIQAYSDYMRNFRDTFRKFLGVVITGIQVGMGPAGELRYPSCPSEKLSWAWRLRELGEFQCYDKYMLASLNACARDIGMREWGNGGPLGASNLMQNPEETSFFRSNGSWNTPYGRFFLEWYSGMLLLHGERLCMAADTIFWSTGAKISTKVAGIHWHYGTESHPSELTAGYYNTSIRDGYLPIARMLGRYRMTLCCTCFDVDDKEEEQMNPSSSPEGFLRQLIFAARMCGIPLTGENSVTRLDDASLKQVVKSSKLYTDSVHEPSFSFNFVRMNKNLFDARNWTSFTRFVRQMSDARPFRAKLDVGRKELCFSSTPAAEEVGVAFAYC
ncbi:beta-amylase 1, chloroplastic-like [Magnolia sinica]|uniref:beta-amylase 1, chloroplastic-like n=1 Tax=Magnolia sinica TaxID=86752 RepID=UPI00265AE8B3|nr:beta-amylase 1, chloroplastic-like [Magnolia sinica]